MKPFYCNINKMPKLHQYKLKLLSVKIWACELCQSA